MTSAQARTGEGYVEWETAFADQWHVGEWVPPSQHPETDTIYDTFEAHTKSQPTKPFLGWREPIGDGQLSEYKWLSWGDTGERVAAIGSGVSALLNGVGGHSRRVGIFSQNCPDWVMCEYASFRHGLTVVPVYPTCGAGTIDYIVRHAELPIVFCYATILNSFLEDIKVGQLAAVDQLAPVLLKFIILIGSHQSPSAMTDKARAVLDAIGAKVLTIDEVAAAGKRAPVDPNPCAQSDIYSIIYTSGSEGTPKGVEITHGTVVRSLAKISALPAWGESVSNWVYYSYLPLAHVFEREVLSLMIRSGATIGFSSGLPNLVEDMEMVRPHFIIGVPRVWKRIYDKVNQTAAQQSFLKRTVFNFAVSRKTAAIAAGTNTLFGWDSLVLGGVAAKLGGRLKVVINGAAAADPQLALWFSAVFNTKFYLGYGMTESFGAIACQHPGCDDNKSGIGSPVLGMTYRLVDVPDMNYFATDKPFPRGEICVKGQNVAKGYFKNPLATAAAFGEDGFLRTGDIGQLHPDGTVTIIDRKKNLFKLAQGEYIAVEMIETVYLRTKDIAQLWVWGDTLSNFLVAVVVPNWAVFEPAVRQLLGDSCPTTHAEICAHNGARKMMLAHMEESATAGNLLGYQKVKAVLLEPEPWTIESNLLTPTFKARRGELVKRYSVPLAEVCAEYKKSTQQN